MSQFTSHGQGITVVITTFNDQAFLAQALASVVGQHHRADEILVVDDGSNVSPLPITQNFVGVTLLRKLNGGLASARNHGLQAARGEFICFLDADDRLEPHALSSGLACFRAHDGAAMVYGGHRRIRADGSRASGSIYHPLTADPYADLLRGNLIGMHGAVLYRRDLLLQMRGYNETLRRCEDYDLYLRIAREHRIASHSDIIAEYRWHGRNMSRDTEQMLPTALAIHAEHRPSVGPRLQAWILGEQAWKDWYTNGQYTAWEHPSPLSKSIRLGRLPRLVLGQMKTRLRRTVRRWMGPPPGWPPPLGAIDFGSLARTDPASHDFGWDRGTPVDRYYVESFLATNSNDIRGRVMEIGDDSYTRQFGGSRVTQSDVLHVNPDHPTATLKGDLTQPGVVPEGAFDCIICTQTLQFIFEMHDAAERLFVALRPGGVLLLTVPGISQIDRLEWKDEWCWSFTITSLRRLFQPFFSSEQVQISSFGNVFAAICFLFGAVLQEIDHKKLDVQDRAYPVIITLRAQRPE